MRAGDYRRPLPGPNEPGPLPDWLPLLLRRPLAIPAAAGAAVLALVLVIVVQALWARPAPAPLPPPSVPQEVVGPQRVVLGDYPDRGWLSYYRANRRWLGDPRWGERPHDLFASCVGFTNYVVCHNPDPKAAGTAWEFLPLLLGEQHLPTGAAPQLDAPLAPAVRAYLSRLEADGEDWFYWLGRVVSPAYCPPEGGECFQVFQRQVLRWPAGNSDPGGVRVSPLGLDVAR
jgi:hypothetical protein